MEYFLEPNVIEYVCACGLLSPLTKLYFCRHCLKLRCQFCLFHEVITQVFQFTIYLVKTRLFSGGFSFLLELLGKHPIV